MNILFVAKFPIKPNRGGVQRVTYTLADEFERIGMRVLFLSLESDQEHPNSNDMRQKYLSDTTKLWSEENLRTFNDIIFNNNIDIVINQAGIYQNVTRFFSSIESFNFNLITVHHNCVKCLNVHYRDILLGNFKNNYLTIIIDHPLSWKFLRKLHRYKYGNYFKRAIDLSDNLVLLSDSFIPELEYFGIKEEYFDNVKAISNPASFDPDPDALKNKECRFLYVGRLCLAQKRVDRLLNIWEKLHKEHNNYQFDIVGDGTARKWMESEVKDRGLDRIIFHGYSNPIPYLRRAKFFTLTSDFEGFGMVLLEAQAYGVVPISFECFSGVENIIPEEAGIIIKGFNELEYVNRIRILVNNEDLRERMAKSSLRNVIRFKVDRVAKEWINLFNSFKD